MTGTLAALFMALGACGAGFAFQAPNGAGPMKPAPAHGEIPTADGSAIRVETALVEIPVHVTNALGANVTGLSKSDFELSEDHAPQTITHFSMEDAPASIGLVYDCSGSMHDKMKQAAAAAQAFFHTANPEDEFFLVEFGDWPKLAAPFTKNLDDILGRILKTKPFGRTALLDALQMAIKQMKKGVNRRRALVILSDGGDNQSRHSLREIERELIEADVQAYAMGLFSEGKKLPPEERDGPRLLQKITESTGGRVFTVSRAEDLPGISARISKDLRMVYVLGYSPAALSQDGKYHRIEVHVSQPDLRVYSKTGYFSPR
jgi:VWFA-related protein